MDCTYDIGRIVNNLEIKNTHIVSYVMRCNHLDKVHIGITLN